MGANYSILCKSIINDFFVLCYGDADDINRRAAELDADGIPFAVVHALFNEDARFVDLNDLALRGLVGYHNF